MKLSLDIARKFEQLELLVPPKNRLFFRYYGQKLLGALEPEMQLLPSLVSKDKLAIDIGANKGIYTYLLSKLAKHVHSFEPISELCDYISAYSHKELITVHNCALSKFTGETTLYIPLNNRDKITTRASLLQTNQKEIKRVVPVKKLDDFSFCNVGFIKIDVEGAECEVIIGAMNTITNNRPNLIIEMADLNKTKTEISEILKFLYDLNYKPYYFDKILKELSRESFFDTKIPTVNYIFMAD